MIVMVAVALADVLGCCYDDDDDHHDDGDDDDSFSNFSAFARYPSGVVAHCFCCKDASPSPSQDLS